MAKKKDEPVTSNDLLKVSGKDLRLAKEAHAKMTVYAEQVESKLAEMTKERDDARADLAEQKEWATNELNVASAQAQAAVTDLRLQLEEAKTERSKIVETLKVRTEVNQATLARCNSLEALVAAYEAAPVSGVLQEVKEERVRQDAKWGEQNHPDGTCAGPNGAVMAKQHADAARSVCDQMAKIGKLTWAHILTEELMEAYAETDESKLRKELIQTAAVAVSWIEAIDRRIRGRTSGE